jgi:hypothetical protein
MSSENPRLDRFEELYDRLEEMSKSYDPDLEEITVVSLLALINDQLAFLRNQHETGRLPSDLAQTGMQLLESPFVYGYLVGSGAYVGKIIDGETSGSAAIDAMREAFAELYRDQGERNWNSSQAVPKDDVEFAAGMNSGSEDLRRFLSRLQGQDIGPTNGIAEFIHKRLHTLERSDTQEGPIGDRGFAPQKPRDVESSPQDDDPEVEEILAIVEDPQMNSNPRVEKLERLIRDASVLYGTRGDPRLVDVLDLYFQEYRGRANEASRHDLYRGIVNAVEAGSTSYKALEAFLTQETSPSVVSTAALDYAVFHPVFNGDLMTGPKAVFELFEAGVAECRAGLFKGLLLLGDDRVCDLIKRGRRQLTEVETRIVCSPGTGYLFAATIKFLIGWLEEVESEDNESKYGLVAAAIGNLPRGAIRPVVGSGRRKFPVDPQGEVFEDGFRDIPLDQYAQRIGPYLREIARREPPPQVMPLVLAAWGLRS